MSPLFKRVRIALLLVIAGMLVQLVATFYWTPLTFILSAGAGVGAVGLGAAVYLYTWWKSDDHASGERGGEL